MNISKRMKESSRVRLIVMAHPDDPELSCGGTIAQWAEQDEVFYIIVSSGEKGTWDRDMSPFQVAETRERETKEAAQFLGVKKVIFLRHTDGGVDTTKTLKIELAALIRFYKPYTIVTHDPWRRHFHPDHRVTGFAVINAIMIARDWHFYPFLKEVGLTPHRSKELLFTPTDKPTFVNDVSTTFHKKLHVVRIHKSQLKQLPNWEQRIKEMAETVGKTSGFKYGEGFFQMRI